MASIIIKKEEFPDIVIAFMLDKLMRGDEIMGENEDFTAFMNVIERKGLKPFFLHYYLSSDATVRSKYKMFSKATLTGKSESGRLAFEAGEALPKKKETGLKALIKRALKLVVSHKKRSGFPLSEEKVDKILDDFLEKEILDKESFI